MPHAPKLVEAIDRLLEAFRVWRERQFPYVSDVDEINRLYDDVFREATLAGVGEPPPLAGAEMTLPHPSLGTEYPNRGKGNEWEQELSSLRARAVEACTLNTVPAMRPEISDPSQCPGCKWPVPDDLATLPTVVCEGCGRWELGTGLAVMPVAGPPGVAPRVVRLGSGYWKRRQVFSAAEDPTAYRPAIEFVDSDRFPNLKAVRAFLKANPKIRTKRPLTRDGREHPQRLLIHAGDWLDHKNRPPADPLDNPGPIVEAVLDAERRKEAIDRNRGRE